MMATKIGLNLDKEIDFSLFNYSSEQIHEFGQAAIEIEKYFQLPITEGHFNDVINIWYRLVSVLPLPIISADVNFILRSRPSKEFEVFNDEADISYNSKCPDRIGPGRFNRPEEAVFYGTLPSDKQEKFVAAVSIESYKELISEGNKSDVLYYHFCKFLVKNSFPLVNLCFEHTVLNQHPGLNRSVTAQIQNLKDNLPTESFEAIIRFWHYISRLASERKLCDQHYMINTALFCTIRNYYETITTESVIGMIYPSPMLYGNAVNIVMMPHAVDKYLQADDCFIFKYVRAEDNEKNFETDICSKPSKVLEGKLNICDIIWGRQLANYRY